MRRGVLIFLAGLAACAPAQPPRAPSIDPNARTHEVNRELDGLHDDAATGDDSKYLAHFDQAAVYLGTDATERWDFADFAEFVHGHFQPKMASDGTATSGWKYRSLRRAVTLSADGNVAWFDEDLLGAAAGPTRGSGVLVRKDGRFRIVQYVLSVPIPNQHFAEVRALVSKPVQPPLDVRVRESYERAVAAATRGDLGAARTELASLLDETKTHPEQDLEFWIHNELTWVHWAGGNLDAAEAEVHAAGVALEHSTLDVAKKNELRLHERWDRAYLAFERVQREPNEKPLVTAATKLRAEYEAIARPANDHDGMAVLEAFSLVQTGKDKAAAVAARKVDIAQDSDLQDLYVLALALRAGGDVAGANRIVARVCAAKPYLMKPLLLPALTKRVGPCPPP